MKSSIAKSSPGFVGFRITNHRFQFLCYQMKNKFQYLNSQTTNATNILQAYNTHWQNKVGCTTHGFYKRIN